MKTYEQLVQELDSKIPFEEVAVRDAGQGRKLSYLEGWYVINRLNQTLGQGNWAYSSEVSLVHADPETNSVHYIAKVRMALKFPNAETTEFTDYGYGDGKDKYSIGKAHELAVKEAVTDGVKRCAKNLGMSLGLALYDKSRENVEDEVTKPAPIQAPISASAKREATPPSEPALADLIKLIGRTATVAIDKRRTTVEALKARMSEFGVSNKEKLNFEQAKSFLQELQTLVQ
jgi:DNA repair and recombination protein RAD52